MKDNTKKCSIKKSQKSNWPVAVSLSKDHFLRERSICLFRLAIYKNRAQPKLTFIIVKKRHNTRFFLYENDRTSNIPAGTVIDKGITHPSQFDFYLCSQAAG